MCEYKRYKIFDIDTFMILEHRNFKKDNFYFIIGNI